MLKIDVSKKEHSEDKWLHMIEFVYNNYLHNSIGVTSFYVLYGLECRTLISLSTFNTRFESINDMISVTNEIRELAKLVMKSARES